MRAQVTELCSNYGKIHGFWWDAIRWREDADKDPGLNQLIRKLQPDAVINDRGFDEGDFGTPERDYRPDDTITFKRPTEACQAVGKESWGYRVNEDYYTDRHLMRSIDRYLTRDANYLLNVGPRSDGTIDGKSVAILKRIGKWYNTVKESLEDVLPASSLTTNRELTLTRRDRTLYVHLNTELAVNAVRLKPLNVAPLSAILLNNGRKVDYTVRFSPSDHLVPGQKAYLNLVNLPVNKLCNEVPVVKLEFDRSPDELVQPVSPMDGVLE
jgi:alpha-L-fucosidase